MEPPRTVGRRWHESERVAVGGPGGLLLHSVATDHYPAVRLELRDDSSPTTPDGWDHVLELTCDIESAVRLEFVRSRGRALTAPASTPETR